MFQYDRFDCFVVFVLWTFLACPRSPEKRKKNNACSAGYVVREIFGKSAAIIYVFMCKITQARKIQNELFIWSRVGSSGGGLSRVGRANFSLISLKNSTNCLHENANSSRGGETTRVGELSRLGR